jgi:hypothetical protein
MMTERIMFVYRGIVTSDNSVPLLMLLEKEMETSDFGFVGRKRLFMFVLESLQNVSRHSFNVQHANMSLVVYSKAGSGYTVTTGNVLANAGIDSLRMKLDEINSLETKDIRSVYRQMLSSSEFSTKGGAGLGLIEMAKKTGNKLDYDFVPVDNDYSYFVLSKTVDAGGVGSHKNHENAFDGRSISQLEKLMAENSVYLIWSGHISADIGKEVISFTETKLTEDDVVSGMRKRVFSILVETLDNVSKYSPGREAEEEFGMPIAMVGLEGKSYMLTTGNLILNTQVPHLKEMLDEINSCDREALRELFMKTLSFQTAESDSTGNMGLIDMARKSGNKLAYEFERINDLYSYYMLRVRVDDKQNQSTSL